jgi:hypothetical protein
MNFFHEFVDKFAVSFIISRFVKEDLGFQATPGVINRGLFAVKYLRCCETCLQQSITRL